MLSFPSGIKHEPKCNVTYGVMGHLDPKQPPIKRKPFAAILNHNFIQKTELILPEELYEIVQKNLPLEISKPSYSRVILPLSALLEGEFFNEYIKRGNILMLSEGKPDVDNAYSLKEGVLTLHLDKESYERAGIVGKPDGVKGKRGTKPRWVIEIELRLPSMLHGKKGFDRIVYAFKNVLNTPVTWLFLNLGAEASTPDPLEAHFPTRKEVSAASINLKVNMPSLKPPTGSSYEADFEDYAVDIHEWLALVLLNSPRLDPDDMIDSFLSRYAPPGDTHTPCKLVKITWRGFLSPRWAHQLFVQTLLSMPKDGWFALCVDGFGEASVGGAKHCTIMKLPDAPNEYVLWELS